ncbi:uncharacterized protein zgc:113184 [Cyprinodon tularosa]|uniref:uncharacterized protein zgc:113184 n=1 Tax=Cyprinodon tularosa TaxID=77115 RepID=UPI0018E286AE|nr:uncharacterized protein zgc:113184 [Cyprinodon tularosa]XP_038153947.1 uncharacterized protein zgc:113184 [Cyprinodon tularosa]XP_038153948.1 uncharacterized protein zgc:113184 [Cyprinodon tularosa]XP_038153949.1 uncharacterized protein zgc:113184 [Cyprinodon tularosa]
MEEAYSELYQQFLRLRSLCLKQAALLHQLTTALHNQQGISVTEAEVSDLISFPLQCSPEIPAFLHGKPQPQAAPTQPCGAERFSRDAGCSSGVLAEGMSKLSVDTTRQRKQDAKMEMFNPFTFNLESSKYLGASSSESKPSEQNSRGENGAQFRAMMPVKDGGLLTLSGAGVMSDVALHSHVCEFCQAVFPGDSTTKGEFLRHLCTHVT